MPAVPDAAPPSFRLAALMATLSRATDLTNGSPFEQSLAAAVIAARLAEAMGFDEDEARDAYYLTMLRTVGCTGDGDLGRIVLGEDVGGWITHLPNGSPLGVLAALVTQVGRGEKPLARARAVTRAFGNLSKVLANTPTHCELGKKLAERLGLGARVARGLEQMFERWDGAGKPNKLKHDQIERVVGVAHVATDAHVMRGLGGVDATVAMVRARGARATRRASPRSSCATRAACSPSRRASRSGTRRSPRSRARPASSPATRPRRPSARSASTPI